MGTKKISELIEATELNNDDLVPVVDIENEMTKKITVENLSNVIKNYVDKSILTIQPSSNTTYSSTGQYQSKKLTNLSDFNVKGSKISLNNNEIQFDSSVKYIKISGILGLNVVSSGKTYGLNIIRSNGGTSKGGINITQVTPNGYFQNISLTPILFPIEEGDILTFYIYFGDANISARVETYSTFTVEEV